MLLVHVVALRGAFDAAAYSQRWLGHGEPGCLLDAAACTCWAPFLRPPSRQWARLGLACSYAPRCALWCAPCLALCPPSGSRWSRLRLSGIVWTYAHKVCELCRVLHVVVQATKVSEVLNGLQ